MIPIRTRAAIAAVVAMTLLGGCASKKSVDTDIRAGGDATSSRAHTVAAVANASRLDRSAKAALVVDEVDAADPTFPLSSPEQFDAVVLGTVDEFSDGPTQPVAEDDPDPIRTVILRLTATTPLVGKIVAGDPVYVRLFTDDLDGLRRALPSGTPAVVALSTVNETVDRYLTDPFAGVPKDATRYIAGAPYAAFADGPNKTWFPLLGLTSDVPLSALVPPQLQDRLP